MKQLLQELLPSAQITEFPFGHFNAELPAISNNDFMSLAALCGNAEIRVHALAEDKILIVLTVNA